MTTFKLDKNNNLCFESEFELLSGADALIQDIRNMLLMFKGEYPFDSDIGLDYYGIMSNQSKENIETLILDRIRQDERVKSIKNVETNAKNGELSLSMQILTSWGELVNV